MTHLPESTVIPVPEANASISEGIGDLILYVTIGHFVYKGVGATSVKSMSEFAINFSYCKVISEAHTHSFVESPDEVHPTIILIVFEY